MQHPQSEHPQSEHPQPIRPEEHAKYDATKMGKSTLYRSDRMLVGLNAFGPGQEHSLHSHPGTDKLYHVLSGRGLFRVDDQEFEMEAGMMLVARRECPMGFVTPAQNRSWCWPSSPPPPEIRRVGSGSVKLRTLPRR